jgi:hypothetical protein
VREREGGEQPRQSLRFASPFPLQKQPSLCSMYGTIRRNSFYVQLRFTRSFIELGAIANTAELTRTYLRKVQRLAVVGLNDTHYHLKAQLCF